MENNPCVCVCVCVCVCACVCMCVCVFVVADYFLGNFGSLVNVVGSLRIVAGSCGPFSVIVCVIVDCFGSLWFAVYFFDRFELLWIVVDFFGSLWVVVGRCV